MNIAPTEKQNGWGKSFLWLMLAVTFFHLAYTSIKFPALGLFIFGYAYFLVRLTDQPTVKRAFYFGLAVGFLCAAPQANFFWGIFKQAAIVLWLVFAFWIGLFTAIVCGCNRLWGKAKAMWLIPVVWTGLEYFRSELYYLKFSWLNIGYALPPLFNGIGMYGLGFLVFTVAVLYCHRHLLTQKIVEALLTLALLLILWAMFLPAIAFTKQKSVPPISIVGVQMEFPPENIIPRMLNQALAKNTNAPILVLSEYTLEGSVPDSLKKWCHDNSRFLIVFFKDGLPATNQKVWNSPWGKIGICICYDLSYTRVTDELVKQGAQLLIVPTMDVDEWGLHEHELHSRVAPVRAAEYGIPIFRVASSGVSQAVLYDGDVIAKTSIPGNGDIFSAQFKLPMRGSLPPDRFLAPFCVFATGVILIALLIFA